ncbi:MAG: amino acid-binding protein [Bacteroidaceae bacterium]|nr:amino acid-binding protein [Bacteroidaceae bacterium]
MIIKQLSIFLENRTGRINEVTKILGANGINMQAFSMAETADFGILRLIVPDVEKAVEVLRAADFAVMLTDVLCVNCPNVPGALAEILDKLAEKRIFIEYMYAFSDSGSANVIIRPDDISAAMQVLSEV